MSKISVKGVSEHEFVKNQLKDAPPYIKEYFAKKYGDKQINLEEYVAGLDRLFMALTAAELASNEKSK